MATQYISDWTQYANWDPMESGSPQQPSWWQGAGNYTQTPGTWSGDSYSPGSYAYVPPSAGVQSPTTYTAAQQAQDPYVQGYYNPGTTTNTWQGGADGEGTWQMMADPSIAIPRLDFGNFWTHQGATHGGSGGLDMPTNFGATPEMIQYLNETYGSQLNQNILDAMSGGGAAPYGIQGYGVAGNPQLMWGINDLSNAQAMFDAVGGLQDPQVQAYLNALAQSMGSSQQHATAYDAAMDSRDRDAMMATLAVMAGGAGLGALGGAAFAPSELALSTLGQEMATMMASQGFSQAAIQQALAANGLLGGSGGLGALSGDPFGGAQWGQAAGAPGYDAGMGAFGDLGLGGYSPAQVAGTTPTGSGGGLFETLQNLAQQQASPQNLMKNVGQQLLKSLLGGGAAGTTGGVGTGGGGGMSLMNLLGGLGNTAFSMQGQENKEDKLNELMNMSLTQGDYYRPWRADNANWLQQSIIDPESILQGAPYQRMLEEAKNSMLAKDAQAGQLFNAPERTNQYLNTMFKALQPQQAAANQFLTGMGDPDQTFAAALLGFGKDIANAQDYSPLYGGGLQSIISGLSGTGGTAGGSAGGSIPWSDLFGLFGGGSTNTGAGSALGFDWGNLFGDTSWQAPFTSIDNWLF